MDTETTKMMMDKVGMGKATPAAVVCFWIHSMYPSYAVLVKTVGVRNLALQFFTPPDTTPQRVILLFSSEHMSGPPESPLNYELSSG